MGMHLAFNLATAQEKLIESKQGVLTISFCSLKTYTVGNYKNALQKVNFPSYEMFNDVNGA